MLLPIPVFWVMKLTSAQNEAPAGKATSRVAAMHKAQAKREREAARAAARAAAPKAKKPAPKVRRLAALRGFPLHYAVVSLTYVYWCFT